MACTYLIIPLRGHCRQRLLQHPLRRAAGPGRFRHPVIFLIIACLLNIVLDVWFVAGFHWDVAGVAIATIISQIVSGGLCLIRMLHMRDVLQVKPAHLRPKAQYLKQLIKLGTAQRTDPGHLLLRHDYPPVPDKLLRHGGHRGQHRCDARGRSSP